MSIDPQEREWREHEAHCLATFTCPYGGSRLHLTDLGDTARYMCAVCDCFGIEPAEVGPRTS